MSDPYWDQVKKDIDKRQEELKGAPMVGRCVRCNKLFDIFEEMQAGRKIPSTCGACALSPTKKSAWRGKGSYGKKPGEAAGDNIMEDIVGKIEDGATES